MVVCINSFSPFTSLDSITVFLFLKVAKCVLLLSNASLKASLGWDKEIRQKSSSQLLNCALVCPQKFLLFATDDLCGWEKNTNPVIRNLLRRRDACSCVCCLLVCGTADYLYSVLFLCFSSYSRMRTLGSLVIYIVLCFRQLPRQQANLFLHEQVPETNC